MISSTSDFAEHAFRRMVGKRVTLACNGRVITGKVLPGIWSWRNNLSCRRFRLRARETHYVLLSAAPSLRLAPVKHRAPQLLNRGRP